MQDIHKDKDRYFEIQYLNSQTSILPFIQEYFHPEPGKRVLEIGSAEGGVLKAFVEKGCTCVGVELSPGRVELAKGYQADAIDQGRLNFMSEDIHEVHPEDLGGAFDLIILKDVIEHIHDQDRFMKRVSAFLKSDGIIFFGFPSWRMPYGGHQQIAKSKIASALPYYHLLPMPVYKGILSTLGERDKVIADLVEIKETGISTARFERLCDVHNLGILKRQKYFIAPIYEYKFGLKPKKLPGLLGSIPFFNDFITFQSYYVVQPLRK